MKRILDLTFSFYPVLQGLSILACTVSFVRTGEVYYGLLLIFLSYLMSPLAWRAISLFSRNKVEGVFKIGVRARKINLWQMYYHLQVIYTAFPVFERALRLVPGAYSAWLRLWGSKIGKKVYWTPNVEVVDRGHLDLGDRIFIGHNALLSGHILKKSGPSYLLLNKRISIGDDAMISYATHIAPGVKIGERALIEAGARLYPNTLVHKGERYIDFERKNHAVTEH